MQQVYVLGQCLLAQPIYLSKHGVLEEMEEVLVRLRFNVPKKAAAAAAAHMLERLRIFLQERF
jgi:hypothetical protein